MIGPTFLKNSSEFIKEFTIYLVYFIFLYLNLCVIYYISTGLQYEYFSAWFSYFQAIQFDWQVESSISNLTFDCSTGPDICSQKYYSVQLSKYSLKTYLHTLNQNCTTESNMWRKLNYNLSNSFVKWFLNDKINMHYCKIFDVALFYALLQFYVYFLYLKFITPGLFQMLRQFYFMYGINITLIGLICFTLCFDILIPCISELQIEILDSELMYKAQ